MKSNQLLESKSQKNIMDTAIELFSKNGYRKTSIKDISDYSNVSKSLVFHYFSSKKELYLALIRYVTDITNHQILLNIDVQNNDLFNLIEEIQKNKIRFTLNYPNYLEFLESVHFETYQEVHDDIKLLIDHQKQTDMNYLVSRIDRSKFKDGVSVEMIVNLITWISEGYVRNLNKSKHIINPSTFDDFNHYLTIIKDSVLKEK